MQDPSILFLIRLVELDGRENLANRIFMQLAKIVLSDVCARICLVRAILNGSLSHSMNIG